MGDSKKMFCPKCGREQSVDGQRFCSGCGMSLDAVIEMVPPTSDGLAEKGWTRKDGMKLSVFIFVAGTLGLTPLAAVLDLDELTPIFAVLGFGRCGDGNDLFVAVSAVRGPRLYLREESLRSTDRQEVSRESQERYQTQ